MKASVGLCEKCGSLFNASEQGRLFCRGGGGGGANTTDARCEWDRVCPGPGNAIHQRILSHPSALPTTQAPDGSCLPAPEPSVRTKGPKCALEDNLLGRVVCTARPVLPPLSPGMEAALLMLLICPLRASDGPWPLVRVMMTILYFLPVPLYCVVLSRLRDQRLLCAPRGTDLPGREVVRKVGRWGKYTQGALGQARRPEGGMVEMTSSPSDVFLQRGEAQS